MNKSNRVRVSHEHKTEENIVILVRTKTETRIEGKSDGGGGFVSIGILLGPTYRIAYA